tara:strand:- start:86 stop:1273 length:1188 start_codon:yes stop_codon:yes gene_type:complete
MKAKEKFLIEATKQYGENAVITKTQCQDVFKSLGIMGFGYGHLVQAGMSAGTDKIKLQTVDASKSDIEVVTKKSVVKEVVKETSQNNATVNLMMGSDIQNLIPSPFEGFVSWGHHSTIKQVVKSKMFYPVFVTGLSGNGKTLMIEQVHAELKKELIRVNITIETDEDDLLGGFRLVNGETKYVPGPVIEAMERGCTLLLDECDLGSNKLMCLQPVLEGKGVYLKKVNKWVTPKSGFNVMATANTKGKGSEDGRFIGTNILNEAFLERFAVTIEQPYASNSVEKKIVLGSMKKYGNVDEKFATNLVQWSEVIRKTFYEGGVDEVISTRRLDHIVKAFAIFKDKMKSIELCVSRFDEDTKVSFLDLYTKIDAGVDPLAEEKKEEVIEKEIVDDENDF